MISFCLHKTKPTESLMQKTKHIVRSHVAAGIVRDWLGFYSECLCKVVLWVISYQYMVVGGKGFRLSCDARLIS